MLTYLDAIVELRREDLARTKAQQPLSELKARCRDLPRTLGFEAALRRPGIQVIAEVKKASPSRGDIAPHAIPVQIARSYAEGGAAAISVLTEERHFKGKLEYLQEIKQALGPSCPPLLRKDFIVEPYQVYEARAYGADALLLIVPSLTDGELSELSAIAEELGLACLVEVHDSDEAARAVGLKARVIGINNRDLRSFKTDLSTTQVVRPHIPDDRVVVSESGIRTRVDVERLAGWDVKAFLVGEALMSAADPGAELRKLLGRHD